MITEVYIRDNKNTPITYLSKLDNFKNGTKYEFKEGVNVIVGENGCGKTTLLNLIRAYLLIDDKDCDKGLYNSNINKLFRSYNNKDEMLDGVDVYADYERNTFRLCHASEISEDGMMKDFNSFGTYFTQKHSSTGESVNIALTSLFNMMFSANAKLKYDYGKLGDMYPMYVEYVGKHKIKGNEWTIIMDEPDRNLDIEHIDEILGILSFHKEQTQIISVVHNPLLIYSLSKNKEVNMIELTDGYVNKVCSKIENIINNN